MRTNTTKAKLNEGNVVFGGIITRYAPDMVEIFGALGYDFVMIDCEHGPATLDQVEHMVRAAESFGITPIARIPDHSEQTILRYLDRGLQGIIVPHVNTGAEAAAVARAARYSPEGYRGVAGGRAHNYGIGVSMSEATAWINSQLLVIPMVEDIEAVNNLDDILQVTGADVLHVAPSDLGQSLGNPGAAEVRRVMSEVIPRIRAGGKHVGVGGNSPNNTAGVAEFIKQGANFVTISAWALLRVGAEDFLKNVNAQLWDGRSALTEGVADRIRQYLCGQVDLARERGDKTLEFRAGDVHAALHLEQQMPNVCQVLEGRRFHDMCGVEVVRVISSPPSGRGANLIIEYRIL